MFTGDHLRPDRWGIIIDYWTIPGETELLVNIWECIEGRFDAPEVQQLIRDLVATRKYVVVGRPIHQGQQLSFPEPMFESDKLRFVDAAIKALTDAQDRAEAAG